MFPDKTMNFIGNGKALAKEVRKSRGIFGPEMVEESFTAFFTATAVYRIHPILDVPFFVGWVDIYPETFQ